MARQTERSEQYIQVGFTAARDPLTGEFLPAVPLFIEATDAAKASADKLCEDLGGLLARQMRQYIDANRRAGLPL